MGGGLGLLFATAGALFRAFPEPLSARLVAVSFTAGLLMLLATDAAGLAVQT